MDTQFNVVEVLRIAEEVEHKAAKFYLRAAERFTDSQRRNICYNLASWRVKHEQAWIRLRDEYSERTGEFGTFDPDNYVRSNPQVMASLPWFGSGSGLKHEPNGYETGVQIVRDAIRRVESVLIFYHGLKEFARDPNSQSMIDAMICEEDRHLRQLNRSLDRMLGASSGYGKLSYSHTADAIGHH